MAKLEPGESRYEALVDAVVCTLSASCGMTPERVRDCEAPSQINGIVGMISVLGDVHWSVMLAMPRETACAISQAFAGFEIDYDSEDMGDLVGEIANVLAGDVLLRLERLGVHADMSLPAVMRGTAMGVMLPDQKPLLVSCFNSSLGPFELVLGARAE